MYFLLTFLFSMVTWIVFSGKFDGFHLSLGVLSSGLVAFLASDYLFTDRTLTFLQRIAIIPRFLGYTWWLLLQIIHANFQVLYLAFHPKVKENIEPVVIHFKTRLKSDFAKFVLGNSITLTPGTVTIMIVEDQFYVHAINQKMASALPGEMERRVAQVFDR